MVWYSIKRSSDLESMRATKQRQKFQSEENQTNNAVACQRQPHPRSRVRASQRSANVVTIHPLPNLQSLVISIHPPSTQNRNLFVARDIQVVGVQEAIQATATFSPPLIKTFSFSISIGLTARFRITASWPPILRPSALSNFAPSASLLRFSLFSCVGT